MLKGQGKLLYIEAPRGQRAMGAPGYEELFKRREGSRRSGFGPHRWEHRFGEKPWAKGGQTWLNAKVTALWGKRGGPARSARRTSVEEVRPLARKGIGQNV